jgi:hypothetical protein
VVSVIEPARRAGCDIALRALDDVPPALADVTRDCGPGLRLENLNELVGAAGHLVDRLTYLHLDAVVRTNDEEAERRLMTADLAARDVTDLTRLQVTLATLRPWQRRPPWNSR